MNVFIPIIGQHDNIGDIMHRRVLLSWLRPLCRMHIFVGKAPQDFIEALHLSPDDIVFTSQRAWLAALVKSPRPQTAFCFTSGEMTMSRKRLCMEMLLAPILLTIRLRKGLVFRIGVAIHIAKQSKTGRIWRLLLRSANMLCWRSPTSARVVGIGSLIPDLALAEYKRGMPDVKIRDTLAVTMRYDRPYPPACWLEAVREFAASHALRIVTVAQVRRDSDRAMQLAKDLGASASLPWPDDRSIVEQEKLLQPIYAHTSMIISDRLHALIGAMNMGATPACLLTAPSTKVSDHFEVLGIDVSRLATDLLTSDKVIEFLESCLADRQEICRSTERARLCLNNCADDIASRLGKSKRSV